MNILITGARHGLGACLVKKFLACGRRVYAGLPSEPLGELEPVRDHPRLTLLPLDVRSPEQMEAAARTIQQDGGVLDAVIHAAGILLNRDQFITQESYPDLLEVFQVNAIGPAYLNNLLLPLLEKSEDPALIHVVSETVTIDGAGPKYGPYCMSKTAFAQYAFILKRTLEQQGRDMRVFAVHPGRMKTRMGAENGQITPEESAEGIYQITVGELLARNEWIYADYQGKNMLAGIG